MSYVNVFVLIVFLFNLRLFLFMMVLDWFLILVYGDFNLSYLLIHRLLFLCIILNVNSILLSFQEQIFIFIHVYDEIMFLDSVNILIRIVLYGIFSFSITD